MQKALASLGRVLHAFQKERGATVLFLASKGRYFSDKLSQRFMDTDYAIEEISSQAPNWIERGLIDSSSGDKLSTLFENISSITENRHSILNMQMDTTSSVGTYSHKIIGPIIDIMVDLALSDSKNDSSCVSAYANFLHLKERIGRERALGARGLVLGAFGNPEFLENYQFLISEQKSYHETFLSLANDAQKRCYDRHMDDYAIVRLEEMHGELESNRVAEGSYDITPTEWYDLTTQKIDLMHTVELELIETLAGSEAEGNSEEEHDNADAIDSLVIEQRHKDFIRTLSIFKGLENNVLDGLLRSATIKQYNKGNLLFLQGEQPNRLYIILNGWVKVYKGNESGDETILQMLTSGDMVLESAVFLNAPYPLNAQVSKKAMILSLPAPIIREQVKNNNSLALNVLNGMSLHSQVLIQDVESIRLKSTTERVGWFFLRLLIEQGRVTNRVELPYDKSLIASYLDMKPETFSRTLKKFRAKGFDITKDEVILPNVNSLCGFCDPDTGSVCTRHGTTDCPNPDCIPGDLSSY